MVRADLRDAVYRDLVLLASVGVQPVVVHGGGPEINEWLGRLQIEPQFRDGLRVTTPETMDVVEMVLVGRVNKQIVNGLNRLGARAVGLSGSDGPLVRARTYGEGCNGLVGEVAAVDPAVLFPLLDAGYIPVISSVAADVEGQAHNINADTVAGELAASLQAEKLILLTDTPGILRNREDPSTLIRQVSLAGARELIASGVVAGGMTPKTECCIRALAQGVAAAHIVDGRTPHALLLEVFTDAGIGTMVVGSSRAVL
jgi:acetylglutamate kinase